MCNGKRSLAVLFLLVAWCLLGVSRPAVAYVEIPYTLARLLGESTNVMTMRVEKVDKERNLIVYRKLEDLKGTHAGDVIRHNIGRGGFHPREWQNIMEWAQPGKVAVFMHNGGASETCIDNYWYQAYAGGEWWNMSHAEPFLLRSYAGRPEKLGPLVTGMLAGRDVIVPCMVDGDKNALQLRTARVQRLRANMKLLEYNAQRDFVGWGGSEDIRRIAGMPGFSHLASVGRVDPRAGGVAPCDFDGDGKLDVCVYGASRTVLLQNGGSSFNEASLPYVGGARSADWSDFNGDGKPDLLLATSTGPKLLTNQGEGAFRDESAGLPPLPYYNNTAAAWIDYDGDKQPDMLIANGFLGLRLFRNLGPQATAKPLTPTVGKWFYAGPFDNSGQQGFDRVYPPEKGVDLKAEYAGKGNTKVTWKEGNFTDGQVNNLAILGQNDDVAIYLYREFNFPGPAELPISLGSDDTLTVWLNGERILAENVYRACAPDQHLLTLKVRSGKNALLLKICQGNGGFEYYFAVKGKPLPVPPLFEDVTEKAGLGPDGVGGNVRGDRLAVADVNGDGRQDFLYSGGLGLLVLNTPNGFVELPESGIRYKAGGVTPLLSDFDGDKAVDLFVPQDGACRLFRNDGRGRFTDVTAAHGELAKPIPQATSAAWVTFPGRDRADLLVGCLDGHNRFFRYEAGKGFTDAGDELGLYQKIFNTRGLAAVDLNGDGAPDLIMANEGQDSAILLGAPRQPGGRATAGR